MPAFPYLPVLVIALSTTFTTLAAAETPQQAFAKSWQGKTVIVKRSLYTLVYNERGRLGNTRDGKRDGLIVLTPSQADTFSSMAVKGARMSLNATRNVFSMP